MRNLVEFPITLTEVIECLEKLMVEAVNEDQEKLACGNMTPNLIHKAIQIVKRERFFHGD